MDRFEDLALIARRTRSVCDPQRLIGRARRAVVERLILRSIVDLQVARALGTGGALALDWPVIPMDANVDAERRGQRIESVLWILPDGQIELRVPKRM